MQNAKSAKIFAISRHFCIFADESDSPCRLRQQAARFFLSEHEINNKRRNETMDENELRETLARLEAAGWEPTPSRKTPEKLPKTPGKKTKTPEKLPSRGKTLRKTPENSTAMEILLHRLFYCRTFASSQPAKVTKREKRKVTNQLKK